jgi:hypothetical protein
MPTVKGILKICKNGHRFYKKSGCLTCPVCENDLKPDTGFLTLISAPARRALEQAKIHSLADLSGYTGKQLLQLHGLGPSSIRILRKALIEQGLSLKE